LIVTIHKDAKRWRDAIDRHDLWFDRQRLFYLGHTAAAGAKTLEAAIGLLDGDGRHQAPGGKLCHLLGPKILPRESIVDGYLRLARANLAQNDPAAFHRWTAVLTIHLEKILLLSGATRLFVTEAELAQDVLRSRNDRLSGDEFDALPFEQTWVEFDSPVRVAAGPTRWLEAVGAGFWKVANTPLRLLTFATGFAAPGYTKMQVSALFWGQRRLLFNAPAPLQAHLGFDVDLSVPDAVLPDQEEFERFIGEVEVAAKNLYDFLTSRTFDYVECRRPPKDLTKIKRFRHLQGGAAAGIREYRRIRINKEVVKDRPGGEPPEWIGQPTRVEMPGVFHRWFYCRACGDCHRHDLLGAPCRKCGTKVGPTANLRIERYWHPPHVRGTGKLKEYVRHLA
jgi:hypothetical protein